LKRGPPELPWLMAASVWIASLMVKLLGASICRWSALTMPAVTVPSRPNGLPTATTGSPTTSLLEFPTASGFNTDAGALTLMTAMSVDGSAPTTVALYVAPLGKLTLTDDAPLTTWSLVMM